MNKRYLAVFLIIVVAILAITKNYFTSQTQIMPSDKPGVVVSFYPLAFLASRIGGDFINLTNITPAGIEPHDFEPTARDIAKIYQSKLFISNGGDIDKWADKLRPNLEAQGIATIDMMFETRDVLPNPETFDPHLWLDPKIMSNEADIIANALIKIDGIHAEEYNKNKEKLKNDLAELDQTYQSGLSNCQVREIITSHDAFGYLASRYNFTVSHILGISPEEDPSPKKIAEIANLARNKNIKYIFFETMVSSKLAQTIASEVGATTLVLDPIEGLLEQDSKNNQDYITIMKNNLTNLKTAMVCQ